MQKMEVVNFLDYLAIKLKLIKHQEKYRTLDSYNGFKGHYIKYFLLPEEGEIVNVEVTNYG